MKIINASALTCTFRSYTTLKMSYFNLSHRENFWNFDKSDVFSRGHAGSTNPYQDVTLEYVYIIYLFADFDQTCSWIDDGCIGNKVEKFTVTCHFWCAQINLKPV